jgi:hypothetical protein
MAASRGWWAFGLTLAAAVHGADLRPEGLAAWDQYVRSSDAAMQARLQPGKPFLWIDEAPDRRRRLHAGEILAASVGAQSPKQVPSGLIHHWIGAAFLPNASLGDVLAVVRDYAHYKDYYRPTVVNSRSIQVSPGVDRFSMLLMNKPLFLKIAIENECESTYAQAGIGRVYSIANAVRVQEIEDYGQPSERKLPSGEGGGYVWRLHTITRYQEADGGVYLEVEAIALSRDIPAAARWVVDPIVRRVSKGAIVTSLRQTLEAVSASTQAAAGRPAPIPQASSGFLQSPQH